MLGIPSPKPGDLYLLFHSLPYDFSADLPLALGSGLCLDFTPQQLLDFAEDGLADYLLPGYSLPGIGLNNCCLRLYALPSRVTALASTDLLFLAVVALRLLEPLPIRIGGQFQLGEEGNRILHPTLYQLSSSAPAAPGAYTPKHVTTVASVLDRMLGVERNGFRRLQTALILFGHVSIGFSTSFQLSHLGLFAALEALFVPNGNKALTLSRRVSSFLKRFRTPDDTASWLMQEYTNRRHKLAHGIHDATFGTRLETANHEAFVRLHETTRLCLLGFLSFDDQTLQVLTLGSGNGLQNSIDALGSADGKFVDAQQMRC